MKILSSLPDQRINAVNVLAEMSVSEYSDLIRDNLENNEYQRKRVSSSKTVYSLLKSDLMVGCVIPPVVLALHEDVGTPAAPDGATIDADFVLNRRAQLIILDGLQRTHTILDLLDELRRSSDRGAGPAPDLHRVLALTLRVEIYVGLDRLGILYRMLTLNTGQTPMSLRQQIEMLYSDYVGATVGNIELVREADGRYAAQDHQYVFRDVVEGYNALLNRDELPFDRTGLLENIKSLDKLSRVNAGSEVFEQYLAVLDAFLRKTATLVGATVLPDDWSDGDSQPFGRSVLQIFKKAQAMSGLGAALGKMIDRGIIAGLEEARESIDSLTVSNSEEFLVSMNVSLDWLKNNTSKIGNAQRNYFTFFFRDLLNRDSDSYLDLRLAAESGLRKYQDQNLG